MKILGLNPPSKFSGNVARDLLWGCWCKGRRIAGVQFPPLPLLYVGTVLKEAGFEVDIIDAQAQRVSAVELKDKSRSYDVLFLISATMSYKEDAELLKYLKSQNPDLITIVFGAHPTFLPDQALKEEGVDLIVRHEAEFVVRDLLLALKAGKGEWKKVPGIGFKEDNRAVFNPDYPYIENLDDIPIPDRSFLPQGLDYYNPIVKFYPWTTALSSRGCPSRCTFCTSPAYYGPRYRARSAQNVVDEMSYLTELGFKEIFYRDELFTVDKKRVFDICGLIQKNKIKVSWICSVKASTASFDMLKAMKEAGCRVIRIGVESGVQAILDNVKKDVKIEQIIDVFSWAKRLKINTHAHCMLGMPKETEETIKKTFNFIKKIKPSTVTYGIMTPYPGSEIYRQIVSSDPDFGDGTHIDASSIHTNASFSRAFCDIPRSRLEGYVRIGYRDFYFQPNYILNRLYQLRSFNEIKRLIFAGTQIFSFVLRGDE